MCALTYVAFKTLIKIKWLADAIPESIPVGNVMMSSTHWEVQIIIELMISTCPDSSDGRAPDMLSVGCGFKTCYKLKF